MNSHSANNPSNQISHILSTVNKYKLLWILPMILGVILSAVYAIALRSETWSAKQSLIVRDDLLGQSYKPGRFESLDSMKSAQETIFEIARKPQVIRNALQQVGPPSKGFLGLGGGGYPSEEVIEQVQGDISFSAPNGAEFGRTEVIILNTKSVARERARKFTEVLVSEIISKVSEVRHRKFKSMEAEILQTCEAAESALEDTKVKLREMDQQLGQDAGSMVAGGESAFRDDPLTREVAQLNLERRVVQSDVEQIQGVLQSLKTTRQDPDAIVNISSELTQRQPALDALKREMVEQKGAYALLSGRYTSVHPAVVSARDGIMVMQKQIRLELDNAESDTREQLEIKTAKLQRLDDELADLKRRMAALGEKRADSITLFADIKKRTEVLNNARSNLAEIQGLASSENSDLLTRVDEVQVSTRPDGMGKKALVICGGLGGLMLGMGLVMLLAPPPPAPVGSQQSSHEGQPAAQSQAPQTPQPAAPALADVGLAKAKSGLAASSTVLRDLMNSARKPKESTEEEKDAQTRTQKIIDDRLDSVKTAQNKPAPVPIGTQSPESAPVPDPVPVPDPIAQASPVVNNPFSRKEIETSKSQVSTGAKIVPSRSDSPQENPEPVVSAADLVRSSQAQSSGANAVSPKIEIPDIKPDMPGDAGINKMVDKAFEDELKSASRTEAQTVQMDALSKAIGGSSAAPVATKSLELSDPDPGAQPVAPTKRGAQIKPRSANIRPVDLARQAESDEFDRVSVKGPADEAKPETKSAQKSSVSAGTFDNPFLKNRTSTPSPASGAGGDGSVVPVPDQIRKLSDSIASFAKPVKGKSESNKEKF